MAVKTYREKYQKDQKGVIGWTCNNDFALPWNASDPADIEAANRQLAFQYGWFVDPIVFGRYPKEMTDSVTDGRLPTFTEEEVTLIKGSYDYIGLNHYTTSYIKHNPNIGGNWSADIKADMLKINSEGHLIGPYAQSTWLTVYPEGLRGVLNWVSNRYNQPLIYLFENGVSVPNENDMPISQAVHDDFRVDFYRNYINNAIDAITVDGVNLKSYFGWSLLDNFEWADGYRTRFGMTYVDYKNN